MMQANSFRYRRFQQHNRRFGICSKLAFVGSILITSPGLAQADEPSSPTLLGAAVISEPAYDGSRSTNLSVIPVLMYTTGPWFARTTEGILEGGIKKELISDLNFGIQVAYEDGRERRDAGFLKAHNVPNIDPSLSVGGFVQYEKDTGLVPIDILARYRKDIDSSRGDQLDLRVTAGIYGGEGKRFNAEVYAQSTWASSKAMQTYYGLTDAEAMRTGLPAFKPGSGHLSNQIGLWGSYNLAPHWLLLGNVERHQLEGSARNSPLTEVRYNNYVSIGLAYEY